MTKRPFASLLPCLFVVLGLAAASADRELQAVTNPTASQPSTHLPTYQPPNHLTPTPTCNRPASDMPPRPGGCYGGEFPVGPPPEPIPPPCIAAWTVEDEVGGDPATALLVTVEHPELNPRTKPRGWVRLARPWVLRTPSPGSLSPESLGLRTKGPRIKETKGYEGDATWQLASIDADVSCGKDEAPLAWATLQILNRGDVAAALDAYTGPLPADYLHAITGLAGWHLVYLPLVSSAGCHAEPTGARYTDWEDGYERFRTIFVDALLPEGPVLPVPSPWSSGPRTEGAVEGSTVEGQATLRMTTRRGDEPDYRVESVVADGPCARGADDTCTCSAGASVAAFSLDVLNHCAVVSDHPYPQWFVDFLVNARESGHPCPALGPEALHLGHTGADP